MRTNYRLVLEVTRLSGEVVHREALAPDWEPAVEWTRLAGLRRHGLWQQASDAEPVLEPVWHTTVGEPVLHSFRIRMCGNGADWFEEFQAVDYFAESARTAATLQVTEGRLLAGERVHFGLSAYATEETGAAMVVGFDTDERPQPCVIRDRQFPSLVRLSRMCGDAAATDMPVVIPEHVIEEVCALTEAAGDRETGGVLIGHVCRDEDPRGVGMEVTAQIPARHTVGDTLKLTFTSETWTDVRAAVALRGGEERLLGWWHSHPAHAWCAACPLERQRVCQLSTGFLSADDRALHRAIFPGAISLALVVTKSAAGLETKLFGWRAGVLEARGFHLLPTGRSSDEPSARARAVADVTHLRAATGLACETADAQRPAPAAVDAH